MVLSFKSLLILAILLLALAPVAPPPTTQAAGNISITRSINVAADAWVHISMLDGNHGNCTANQGSLMVEAASQDQANTLLRFDLSTNVPTGSTVTSTTLNLYYYAKKGGNDNPAGRTYYADRITETDWVEGTSCHGAEAGASDWTHRVHDTLPWTMAGGTYTITDEATATVPAATGNWMSWTVTAQTQTAVTSGVAAHFIIRDPPTTSNAQARFRSREDTNGNPPRLDITFTAPWDSHTDSARLNPAEDSFADTQNTVYMHGTGFATGTYNVAYYDGTATGGGNKVATVSNTSVGGTLDSQYLLTTDPNAVAGSWHALAQPSGATAFPSTYDAAVAAPDTYSLVANDSFTVESSAIPEFPTVVSALVTAGLTLAIYLWMRKRREAYVVA